MLRIPLYNPTRTLNNLFQLTPPSFYLPTLGLNLQPASPQCLVLQKKIANMVHSVLHALTCNLQHQLREQPPLRFLPLQTSRYRATILYLSSYLFRVCFDLQADVKPDITFEPTWSEALTRIRRLMPYLWPKSNNFLQFLAVSRLSLPEK